MRTIIFKIIFWICCCPGLILMLHQPVCASEQKSPTSDLWEKVLVAFQKHTQPDKELLIEISKESEDSAEKRLSEVLISEWDLFPKNESLEQPRPVLVPKIISNNKDMQGAVFILKVEVDSNGKTIKSLFVQEPKQDELKNSILKNIQEALFRPAFRSGKFAEGLAIVTVRVEVR